MANLTETSRWEAGIYQFETSDPVMGGPNGIDNRPTRELANRTLWLKNEIAKAVQSIGTNKTAAEQAIALKANAATMLTAGAGLTGGGTLAASRSFALATPSTLNGSTTNWAGNGATGHTHELAKATPTVAGVVKLVNALDVSATDAALTAAMGKKLQDEKLGNSGNQTLNGQLGITRNAWEKMRFTNSDGSFWRFESAPIASGENGARFNWVFTGKDSQEVGRVSFPRVSGGETVAYQSWVTQKIGEAADNKVPSKAYDYWARASSDYGQSGFYRANGREADGLKTPSMEIHIAHPAEQGTNKYGRGIGFSYGPSFGLVTTAWDAEGRYQGMKTVLTEENGVMLSGNQTVGGTKTFSNRADFAQGLRISGSNTEQYSVFLRGNGDWYWSNPISGQALQLKDNGDLAYQNRKIYHEGNKPAWGDIQSKPDVATRGNTLAHYGIVDSVTNAEFQWSRVPTGTVAYFASDGAPHGWLKADGAQVSRSGFADLFRIIGTRYGAGNGSTTFTLPDLRGEFVRGWDMGRGVDSNRVLGSLQADAIRNITGKALVIDADIGSAGAGQGSLYLESSTVQTNASENSSVGSAHRNLIFDASRTVPTANENRPRNIALLACIKA
ncbi:phage tail protein [Neisseria yangbaofengii]|uniref:phage tail protein n=1 Tax=Neisseria yangbaofengii TaxID=2709396 RepID=UPI001D0041A9|nr:phage tail protein [Neisseria yangbaofengii]